MGLTQKILLFTGLLVVALVVTTVAYTSVQADRLAHDTIHQALRETRDVWQTFQADRYNKLRLGIRVLGNDPAFKAMVEGTDQATILDTLKERNGELKADFFIATDPAGVVVARTDRPSEQGEDLAADPLVQRPLEGEEAATVWRQGDRLFHAVSVPMSTGPDLKGVLIAGYGINETLANDIRKLTHSEVAYLTRPPGQPALLSVSSLGPKEPALRSTLAAVPAAAEEPFELDLGGERHVAVLVPLTAATGEAVGSMLALRSVAVEMAAFRKFRTSLLIVSGVVMALALVLAYLAASRITGPVRRLVGLVERARDGSYAGKVTVGTSDEIGVLARSFNQLVAELREKEQMIGFLREGMTVLRKGSGVTTAPSAADAATAETRNVRTGAATLVRGAVFAGRYEVLESIGKGGMGVVFRARDRQLDEVVALKVLREDALSEDESLLGRFKQELKLARRITHRNVLRTHDFGDADGTAYISMEYLEGVTLKDLIRSKGALPIAVGLRIARHMCQGLEAAHAQGVVHRDIKPQNMLILPETGELKIMDFGIARVSEVEGELAGLTTDGSVLGTPDYMPPEQATGGQADFRSDIYSLGVVLFECFTGQLPFTGEKLVQVILGHVQKPPPRPRGMNPQIPQDLEAIILRCLEKKPAARYQKVGEV
ncbi:MAG TPA: protein kinase, partial [Vicinamibacteria bacterium]|nr:protein kinase [Vicinamibacteria bacterium]